MFTCGTEILKKTARVDGLQHSVRPYTSIDDQNINKIKEMVLGNRWLTIRELVDMIGNSFGSVQTILNGATSNNIYIYMLYIYYIYADDAFIYGSSKVVILASFTVSMLHVRELKFWQICYFEKLKKKVTSIRQSIFKKYRNTTKQILL